MTSPSPSGRPTRLRLFTAGSRVVIRGLQRDKSLNGQRGTVMSYDPSTLRHVVKIDGVDHPFSLAVANLLHGDGLVQYTSDAKFNEENPISAMSVEAYKYFGAVTQHKRKPRDSALGDAFAAHFSSDDSKLPSDVTETSIHIYGFEPGFI